MEAFDIPIVLFIFKREHKSVEIIREIKKVKPKKLYLVADGGRNESEHQRALRCRELVENEIDWECTVIKDYAEQNRGVFENIGMGAIRVLMQEENAIFLEDDNLPETTFFAYCKSLLQKYSDNEKILWICGTNYLEHSKMNNLESDYFFSQHMLPCGWATWSSKFIKYYDAHLDLYTKENIRDIKKRYHNNTFYKYDINRFAQEYNRKVNNEKFSSWDYQMAYSLRIHDMYGIIPKYNQIRNIGIDEDSIHGGTTNFNIMTQRFCELETMKLKFPLKHPEKVELNYEFEKKLGQIILPPSAKTFNRILIKILRKILFVPHGEPLLKRINFIKNKFRKKV